MAAGICEILSIEDHALERFFALRIVHAPRAECAFLQCAFATKRRKDAVFANAAAKMSLRRPPCAFTEQGVAMLSSVLRSDRAVELDIAFSKFAP